MHGSTQLFAATPVALKFEDTIILAQLREVLPFHTRGDISINTARLFIVILCLLFYDDNTAGGATDGDFRQRRSRRVHDVACKQVKRECFARRHANAANISNAEFLYLFSINTTVADRWAILFAFQ